MLRYVSSSLAPTTVKWHRGCSAVCRSHPSVERVAWVVGGGGLAKVMTYDLKLKPIEAPKAPKEPLTKLSV